MCGGILVDLNNVIIATSFWQRFRGLMLTKEPRIIVFPYCNAVHTFFMLCPITIMFYDRKFNLLKKISKAKINRVYICKNAYYTVEIIKKKELDIMQNHHNLAIDKYEIEDLCIELVAVVKMYEEIKNEKPLTEKGKALQQEILNNSQQKLKQIYSIIFGKEEQNINKIITELKQTLSLN